MAAIIDEGFVDESDPPRFLRDKSEPLVVHRKPFRKRNRPRKKASPKRHAASRKTVPEPIFQNAVPRRPQFENRFSARPRTIRKLSVKIRIVQNQIRVPQTEKAFGNFSREPNVVLVRKENVFPAGSQKRTFQIVNRSEMFFAGQNANPGIRKFPNDIQRRVRGHIVRDNHLVVGRQLRKNAFELFPNKAFAVISRHAHGNHRQRLKKILGMKSLGKCKRNVLENVASFGSFRRASPFRSKASDENQRVFQRATACG